jgi:hypothetical protein
VIEQLLTAGGIELKTELENLIRGESIEKPVQENIIFRDVEKREDLLWSFLLFSGYLKYEAQRPDDFDPAKILCRLVIPNQEVRSIYIGIVEQWFAQKFDQAKLQAMLRAFRAGDIRLFEHLFREMVTQIFSYHNFGAESEKVYQAFTIGLLVWLGDQYELKSDRESGYGRYDLAIIPKDRTQLGYVIEFKKVSDYENETVDSAIAKAFAQIEAKNYEMELRSRGVTAIKKLAIVFEGKQVWVKEQGAEGRGQDATIMQG